MPFQTAQAGLGHLIPATAPLIATAIATVIFAFNGYEQAIYLADNTKSPRRTLPPAILISLAIGLLSEAIPTLSLLISSTDLNKTFLSGSPYLDFIGNAVSDKARFLMALAISIAVLNACIVNILMTARFIYSTGRDGFWGVRIGKYLAAVHTRHGSPAIATLGAGTFGAAACVLLTLQQLTVVTGTNLVFIYLVLCVCVIVGRVKKTTDDTLFRPSINPAMAIVGAVALIAVLVTNWLDPVIGRPSVKAAAIETLIGLAFYVLTRLVVKQQVIPVMPD